jgi:hypothetical protein
MQLRKRFNEDETRFYIGQIILAFEYLHCCHIISPQFMSPEIIRYEK